jgi:hypothetical protein
MAAGEISLDAAIADLVITHGAASSRLRFLETNEKPVTVMHEADSMPAARCKHCGYFVIISDPEYTDTECLACHTAMPAGVTACPKCGWTYREE